MGMPLQRGLPSLECIEQRCHMGRGEHEEVLTCIDWRRHTIDRTTLVFFVMFLDYLLVVVVVATF